MKSITLRQFENEFARFRAATQNRPAFADATDTARERRVDAARASRWEFARQYLDQYVAKDAAPFHGTWEKIAAENDVVHVVEAFRGAGKSTYFGLIDLLWRIVFDEMHFGIIASLTEDKSARMVGRVLRELIWNRKIAQDFGVFDLSDYSRGSRDFVVVSPANTTAELKAVSIGQDPRGLVSGPHRPDVARLDDIQSRKRSLSPRFVQDSVDWIMADLIPALAPSFHCQISATRVHDRDVVHELEQRAEQSGGVKMYAFPALRDGKPTWPKAFPARRLKRIKAITTTSQFNQEYLLIPISLDAFVFSERWIRYYDPVELPEQFRAVVTWVDPSAKHAARSDFKAVVTVGMADARSIYVLAAWIRRASVTAMVDAMYEQYERCNTTRIYYEDNGGQAILDEVLSLRAEEYGYRLPAIPETNTLNKQTRIEQTLSARVERGEILFHRTDPMQKLLVDQLLQFPHPSAHDDGPDALEGAVRKLLRMMRRGNALPKSALKRTASSVLRGFQ